MVKKIKAPLPRINPIARPSHKILAYTSAGVFLIQPGQNVPTAITSGTFAAKPAPDLCPGDMLIVRKDGIPELTIGQVENVLMESPRYSSSVHELFEDRNGVRRPLFAAQLWRDLERADPSLAGIDGLFEGIVSLAIRNEATMRVRQTLIDLGIDPPTEQHVRDQWLAGNVIAPRNFNDVFLGFAASFDSSAFDGLSQNQAFANAYHRFVVTRQVVMRELAHLRGQGKGNGNGHAPSEDPISVKPELQMVVNHFFECVSTQEVAVRVFRIEQISPKESKHESGILYKGVKPLETQELDLGQAIQAHRVLESAMLSYVFRNLWSSDAYSPQGSTFERLSITSYVLKGILHSLGFDLDSRKERVYQYLKAARFDAGAIHDFMNDHLLQESFYKIYMDRAIDEFSKAIESGSADEGAGIEKGTHLKACELLARLGTHRPLEVYLLESLRFMHDWISSSIHAKYEFQSPEFDREFRAITGTYPRNFLNLMDSVKKEARRKYHQKFKHLPPTVLEIWTTDDESALAMHQTLDVDGTTMRIRGILDGAREAGMKIEQIIAPNLNPGVKLFMEKTGLDKIPKSVLIELNRYGNNLLFGPDMAEILKAFGLDGFLMKIYPGHAKP